MSMTDEKMAVEVVRLTAEVARLRALLVRAREALNEAADGWPRPNKYDTVLADRAWQRVAGRYPRHTSWGGDAQCRDTSR